MKLSLLIRWGTKGLIFLILLIIIFSLLNLSMPPDQNAYFASLIDKHELLNTTPSPRILIIGGSNVAFSTDSETLSKALNKPVINLGVSVALGLRFILNDTAQFMNNGDIVVISPEYELFYNDGLEGDSENIAALLSVYPQAIKSFTPMLYLRLGEISIKLMQLKVRQLVMSPFFTSDYEGFVVYERSSLNRYGDFIAHLGRDPVIIPNDALIREDDIFNQSAIRILNSFNEKAQAKGVKVVLIFPFSRNTNCEMSDTRLEELEDILLSQLEIPILNNVRSSCYPDDLFYDFAYHPYEEGRQIRTHELIELLQKLD